MFADACNSSINANISLKRPILKSLSASKEKGLLLVRATTYNSSLSLSVRDIRPFDSQQANLQLRTRNSLQNTKVSIGPTFQGPFNVHSKMSTVKVKDSVKDTTRSNDETRVYEISELEESRVVGEMGWRQSGSNSLPGSYLSSFDVGSTLGPVYVEFGV